MANMLEDKTEAIEALEDEFFEEMKKDLFGTDMFFEFVNSKSDSEEHEGEFYRHSGMNHTEEMIFKFKKDVFIDRLKSKGIALEEYQKEFSLKDLIDAFVFELKFLKNELRDLFDVAGDIDEITSSYYEKNGDIIVRLIAEAYETEEEYRIRCMDI